MKSSLYDVGAQKLSVEVQRIRDLSWDNWRKERTGINRHLDK